MTQTGQETVALKSDYDAEADDIQSSQITESGEIPQETDDCAI